MLCRSTTQNCRCSKGRPPSLLAWGSQERFGGRLCSAGFPTEFLRNNLFCKDIAYLRNFDAQRRKMRRNFDHFLPRCGTHLVVMLKKQHASHSCWLLGLALALLIFPFSWHSLSKLSSLHLKSSKISVFLSVDYLLFFSSSCPDGQISKSMSSRLHQNEAICFFYCYLACQVILSVSPPP